MEVEHRAEMDAQKQATKTLKKLLMKTLQQYNILMDEKKNAFRHDISAYEWNYAD